MVFGRLENILKCNFTGNNHLTIYFFMNFEKPHILQLTDSSGTGKSSNLQ